MARANRLLHHLALTFFVLGGISHAQSLPGTTDAEIVTDRPDITESSIVVPKGRLQLENGLTWTSDRGGQAFDLSETLIRAGVSTRTEIRIVVPNYLESLSRPASASGFGDLALGMKHQLGPLPGGIDLSVIVALSLPTGAARISSHGLDPFVKFPWSKDLAAGWSIGGMQSVFFYTQDGRRNPMWEPTLYIEKKITKPWDVFVEYAGDFAKIRRSKGNLPLWHGIQNHVHSTGRRSFRMTQPASDAITVGIPEDSKQSSGSLEVGFVCVVEAAFPYTAGSNRQPLAEHRDSAGLKGLRVSIASR
jgi:hypothetical protein